MLLAALGTTLYTICDSEAQAAMRTCAPKLSGTMVSCTYYELRHIAVVAALGLVVLTVPSARAEAAAMPRNGFGMPLLAGVFAGLTYILVLLAMNYVTNVSYVKVFRQMGLPIGMGLGVLILKERCTATKILGVILILTGLVISVIKPEIWSALWESLSGLVTSAVRQ